MGSTAARERDLFMRKTVFPFFDRVAEKTEEGAEIVEKIERRASTRRKKTCIRHGGRGAGATLDLAGRERPRAARIATESEESVARLGYWFSHRS